MGTSEIRALRISSILPMLGAGGAAVLRGKEAVRAGSRPHSYDPFLPSSHCRLCRDRCPVLYIRGLGNHCVYPRPGLLTAQQLYLAGAALWTLDRSHG